MWKRLLGAGADPPPGQQMMQQVAARSPRLAKRLLIWGLVTTALGLPPLGTILRKRQMAENLLAHESQLAIAQIETLNEHRLIHSEEPVPKRATIGEFLERAGLDAPTTEAILRGARPVYNLARIRAGNHIDVIRSGKGDARRELRD